jgi:NitT/TauT family transport system permease protein
VSQVPTELRDDLPTFEEAPPPRDHGPIDWTGLTSISTAKTALEIGAIAALAAAVFFGAEAILRLTDTPTYVFPKPTAVVKTLVEDFGSLYAPHLWVTMQEFLIGLAIGSTVGLALAAVITQKPFVEKVVAPYIIAMVTTPMIALVPFLRLKRWC